MGAWLLAIVILAVIGIPLLIWAGIHVLRGDRRVKEPSSHRGRPAHVHCPVCHEKNAGNAEFCEKCGHRLAG